VSRDAPGIHDYAAVGAAYGLVLGALYKLPGT
jgi:hypothetical protein